MEGNIKRVKELLAKSFDVNMRDSAGYTPLLYAARNGHYRVCEILLDHGADVNMSTRSIRATPLHRAASQSHPEVVDTLLHYGADANLTDVDGKTALHRALSELKQSKRSTNAQDVCKKLLFVTDPTIKDNSGKTVKDVFEEHYTTLDAQMVAIENRTFHNDARIHARFSTEEIERIMEELTKHDTQLREMQEMNMERIEKDMKDVQVENLDELENMNKELLNLDDMEKMNKQLLNLKGIKVLREKKKEKEKTKEMRKRESSI